MAFYSKWLLWGKKKMSLEDAPGSTSKNKASLIKRLGLAFTTGSGAAAKKSFQEPDFSFDDITAAYNTDAYIRQAVDKYVDLIFKSGWDITGKNQKSVDYINLRLAAISDATQMNTRQFMRELGEDLVKYANVFIIKARASGSYTYPPGITVSEVTGKTVAGYYILPPTTIQIAREENGTIANYQQKVSGKTAVEFKPEDIIHIAWKKERGQAFGVSFLTPVLDDVKILRQLEEDVVRLVYRELFPLHTYTVGIDKPGYESTDDEIELVRSMIANMPLDGGLVIPERHKVDIIGTQGKALEVEDYLEYFRARVFSGLGVSESIMGIGGATNRATAESMSDEMKDRIKAFQRVIEDAVEIFIFNELLREGGFDPLIKPEDKVTFKFKEIDLDSRTKIEQSATQLWNNNLTTFEETRQMIGYEPVVTDEGRLFVNMIGAFQTQQQVEVSNAAAAAKAAAGASSGSTTSTPKKQAAAKEQLTEAVLGDDRLNKIIAKHTQDMRYHWGLTRSDVADLIKQYYLTRERNLNDYDSKEIAGILHLTNESIRNLTEKQVRGAFMAGVDKARVQLDMNGNTIPNIKYTGYIKEVADIHTKHVTALLEEDLNHLIKVAMRKQTAEEALASAMGSFESLEYRLGFIADYQLKKAYFYGMARCAEYFEYDKIQIQSTDNCDICRDNSNAVINLKTASIYKSIPPFHPSCSCSIKILGKGDG